MLAIFTPFLYLVILVSLSHYVFDPTHLYYELWWLDIPMHFLGGIGVGMLAIATMKFFKVKISFKKIIVTYLLFALTWELYEYVKDVLYGSELNTVVDSAKDIMMGFWGAVLAFYTQHKKHEHI